MNTRYRFHPDEYELGETEKFYSDMEARGWQLVKRGAYLSKFVPVKPSPGPLPGGGVGPGLSGRPKSPGGADRGV